MRKPLADSWLFIAPAAVISAVILAWRAGLL